MKIFFLLLSLVLLSGCLKQPETIVIELAKETPIIETETEITNEDQAEVILDDQLTDNETELVDKAPENQIEVIKTETTSENQTSINENSTVDNSDSNQVETLEIPTTLELKVLFAQQAPFSNWNEITQETCEEASMIMADKYFKGQPLNDGIMEQELEKLLAWQNERGYQIDLTAEETAFTLREYFGLTAELSRQVEINRIKAELAKGNLVILPVAGRLLKNPNFKQPGPVYHMLVVKGYNTKEFITNDPGTRNGNSYKYPYERLIDAVHDWDHALGADGMTDAEVILGAKVMVIVSR
jgi:hypothetical protein